MKERRRDAAVSDVWIDEVSTCSFRLRVCGRWFVWNQTSAELVHQWNVSELLQRAADSSLSAPCRTSVKVFNISYPWGGVFKKEQSFIFDWGSGELKKKQKQNQKTNAGHQLNNC